MYKIIKLTAAAVVAAVQDGIKSNANAAQKSKERLITALHRVNE